MVFPDVNLWSLHQIEFLISSLFHQVENSILEGVLEHVGELLVHEAGLPLDVVVIVACQLLQVVHVALLVDQHIDLLVLHWLKLLVDVAG